MQPLGGSQPDPMRQGGGGSQGRRTTHFHRRAKRAVVYTEDTAHQSGAAIPPYGAPDGPPG